MELSVIIPTYNGLKLLKDNLPALFKELQSVKNNEVIVIDNNSSDGTEEYLNTYYSSVRYIRLNDNSGFSGAINTGVNIANGRYILILNNDCSLKEKSLDVLLSFLNGHEEFVATQPIVYKEDGTIENIGYVVDLKKAKAEVITDLNYNFSNKLEDIFAHNSVYGLSAACLLFRKNVFKKLGMLDESFHSYLEDIDLFIRLAKENYKYAPCLDANAVHAHMSTSSTMKGYKQWHDLTNWIRIIVKNYPAGYILQNFIPLSIERLRNLKGYLSVILS